MKEQQPQTVDDTPASSGQSETETQLNSLQTENERLRSELRHRSARDSLLSAFAKENARSPELLFEASAPRFEFDDSDSLTNVETLISGLRQRFPEQFEQPQALPALDERSTRNDRLTAPPTLVPSIHAGSGRDRPRQNLTKEALTQMSPQQILTLDWDEVKQVLSQ